MTVGVRDYLCTCRINLRVFNFAFTSCYSWAFLSMPSICTAINDSGCHMVPVSAVEAVSVVSKSVMHVFSVE